jgi:hypothetical protein
MDVLNTDRGIPLGMLSMGKRKCPSNDDIHLCGLLQSTCVFSLC